jgi:diguanylate cyclase (GGDEF)-like protein/PAS domain S-box-containing protein
MISQLADLFYVLADSPVAIALVAGWNGRILQTTEALRRKLGWSASELRLLTLAELAEDGSEDIAGLARRGPDGALIQVRQRYRRSDGTSVWLDVSAARAGRDETGEPYFVCHFEAPGDVGRNGITTLARYLPDTVVLMFDQELRYTLMAGESAEHWGASSLVGKTVFEVPDLSAEEMVVYAERYRRTLEGEEQSFEAVYRDRVFAITLTPMRTAAGDVFAGMIVARDITEAHDTRERMLELAQSDPLTGLPNRTAFRVQLDAALVRAKAGVPSTLMLLDMDNFKSVNDSLGHDTGDDLLKIIAERLRTVVRPGDLVARLSGDEFTVLMQGIVLEHDVEIIAGRVLSVFEDPVEVADQELFMRASLGVARMPTDGDSAAAVLKAADMAMYAAKRQGRGRFQVFQAAMADTVDARLRMSSELHRAVMRGELELHYLPQLSLPGQELSSLEALVRWRHPDRGLLPPAQFISVAEESGLIVELGEWVLRTACAQLADWRARGVNVPRVAVNVSIHQLRDPGFPETVRQALEAHDLGADALELEITESALIDPEHAAPVLAELKSAGVSIAIDDFGTGYSSLDRLRRMPIDVLKVDRAFVADADHDVDAAALVHSIVTLAHNLGLSATAEGVERAGQRELLVAHGCDVAAGWIWSPALPAEDLESWVAGVA